MAAALWLLTASPLGAQVLPARLLGIPSVRFGDTLRVDAHVKAELDWRDFPTSDATAPADIFSLHRARVSLEGTLLRRVDYQVEREVRDTPDPWRDVFVDVRIHRALQVKAGKFKVPFSLDRLTSAADLDFVYRAIAATHLAPGRDVGLLVHGNLLSRRVNYQVGEFRHGGDAVRPSERHDPHAGQTVAARITVRPWNTSRTVRSLRGLAVGANVTSGHVPAGLYSLPGRTVPDEDFFPHLFVSGTRRRVGGDLEWREGPVSVRSELLRVSDQRQGQGTDDDDLADVLARGWYVSGTWLVTGERKVDDVRPAKAFLQGGAGAVELAGRIEDVRFGSPGASGVASRDTRARNLAERSDRAWTFGVNWYLNRYSRVQVNLIRERRELDGVVIPGQAQVWSRVLRVQFAL